MSTSTRLIIVALLSFVGCILAWSLAAKQFLLAYLAAVLLPWSVSVGSIGLLLIYSLTGGKWGQAAWPWLAMNARLMPLVAVMFVPVLLGLNQIYPWANSDLLQQFDHTENRQWFYQTPFFVGRSVFYFVVWSILAWMTTREVNPQVLAEGREPSPLALDTKNWTACAVPLQTPPMIFGGQAAAGLGSVSLLLTITWAGMDWIMSFDPFFGSTLFGALLGMGAMLSAMSAAVAAVCYWSPFSNCSTDDKTISDLAGLLLAFLMLWAYFSFAHFLIMWMGDLPIESRFYAVRTVDVWRWISPILAVGGFVVPFLCLLSYRFKRSPKLIGTLALGLLLVRTIELWWMVLPADGHTIGTSLPWAILPTSIAVVTSYLAVLSWQSERREDGGITHAT